MINESKSMFFINLKQDLEFFNISNISKNETKIKLKFSKENKVYEEYFDDIFFNLKLNSEADSSNNARYLILKNIYKSLQLGEKNISNSFFTIGPRKSGKSTFLRGALNSSSQGFMLNLVKEVYKIGFSLINNKNEIILIKFGCFGHQKDKIFNLIDFNLKKDFFDELFILKDTDNNCKLFIKHVTLIDNLNKELSSALSNRKQYIDHNDDDYYLSYHYSIELKSNDYQNLINLYKIQLDFFECNINNSLNDLKSNINSILMPNIYLNSNSILKNFFIHRILYRNSIKTYNYNYFFLNVSVNRLSSIININIICEYFELLKYFKILLKRKELLIDYEDEEICNIQCEKCKKFQSETIKFHEELYKEIILLNEDLQQVHKKLKTYKSKQDSNILIQDNTKNKKVKHKSKSMPTRPLITNFEKVSKKISTDTVKLEGLLNNLNQLFDRTKNNMDTFRRLCTSCEETRIETLKNKK